MNDRYQVLIVEQADDELRATTIRQTPFETSDASAAKFWADAFNERELAEPIGAWAVVRPCSHRSCAVRSVEPPPAGGAR